MPAPAISDIAAADCQLCQRRLSRVLGCRDLGTGDQVARNIGLPGASDAAINAPVAVADSGPRAIAIIAAMHGHGATAP